MQCLICMNCGRTPPVEVKKCHPCNNAILFLKYCTSEAPIAEYFAILTQNELQPSIMPFESCSITDLAFRFDCASRDLKHSCAAGGRCPLEVQPKGLRNKVLRIKESIIGLCLHCVRTGEIAQSCNCAQYRKMNETFRHQPSSIFYYSPYFMSLDTESQILQKDLR